MNIIENQYKIVTIGNLNENKTYHVGELFEIPPTESPETPYVDIYIKDYHTTDGDMTVLVWDIALQGLGYQGDPTRYYKDVDLLLVVNNEDELTGEIISIQEASPQSKLFETLIGDDLEVISLLRALTGNHGLELL